MLLLSLLLLLLLCAVFLAWLCVGVLYLTLMGFPPPVHWPLFVFCVVNIHGSLEACRDLHAHGSGG
jgi:hypothetical protein